MMCSVLAAETCIFSMRHVLSIKYNDHSIFYGKCFTLRFWQTIAYV